jgi:dolichol-phosphate mannosyltransferase
VVVDDGSKDILWEVLQNLKKEIPELTPIKNEGLNGFGRAIMKGLDNFGGDAVVIFMADQSDFPYDIVLNWKELNSGYDCIFGSRFIHGGEGNCLS